MTFYADNGDTEQIGFLFGDIMCYAWNLEFLFATVHRITAV